jgi:exodeoxyribonuclease VII large subunit
MERTRALPLPALPLAIALVTSTGSAAYHDFLATLRESGFAFRVLVVHSAVQGAEAERSLPGALALAAGAACDCVVLIRGGGSKSDLAVFDSQAVAEAIARAAKPVLTGLGHEIDESVADLVAHQSFKTPTKVAEELVGRIAAAELAVARLREQMMRQARLAVAEADGRLARAERRAVAARARLAQVSHRLVALAEALRRVAFHRLRTADLSLAGWSRLIGELSPARTLRRGFSITRDAAGNVLRDPAAAAAGTPIESELALGLLWSRVESGGKRRPGALPVEETK